ncbi:DUF1343 domain-containing protein [soil metagenome]
MLKQTLMICGLLLGGVAVERAAAASFDQHNLDHPVVKPGIEVLLSEKKYFKAISGKNIGLITNPTGVDSKLHSTIDLLHERSDVHLVRLFGPEHGVRGDAYAGDHVADLVDARTGIDEKSLYGKTRRPPQEYLDGLDVVIYDIQDVGSRSYTYIYTMAYTMEECGKRGIPFLVLDRPNPCGDTVSGNILNPEEYSSFVGLYPIAYQYGMTPGEVAWMFNEKFNKVKCDLTVVPMRNYKRKMMQWDTGLPWVMSSPNIPDAETATYYNLTGIIGELPSFNIGANYTFPFRAVGAVWLDENKFVDAMRAKNLPGIMFRPLTYKPFAGPQKDQVVHGAQMIISDYHKIQPVEVQIHMMEVLQKQYGDQGVFSDESIGKSLFDQVLGTKSIRRRILAGESADSIIAGYQEDLEKFKKLRKEYLIYR